jgi:hypothetical protein
VHAYTRKSKNGFQDRLVAIASEIERHNTPDCIGVCIEKPFGRFNGIDVMRGNVNPYTGAVGTRTPR